MLWFFKSFFPVVWILFIVYWRIKAANTKTNQRVEPAASGILRALTFLIVIVLLSVPRIPLPWLYRQLWPSGLWPFWIGAAVTVVGLLFAIWARQHLASNWSSAVTIKRDHELGSIGEASAVEPLCEALAYSSSYVQFCALRALEQIQGRKLVNSLIPLLRARMLSGSNYRVRVAAAKALLKISVTRVISRLVRALPQLPCSKPAHKRSEERRWTVVDAAARESALAYCRRRSMCGPSWDSRIYPTAGQRWFPGTVSPGAPHRRGRTQRAQNAIPLWLRHAMTETILGLTSSDFVRPVSCLR